MEQGRPEVLFLAHRMPYPPDRGDRIRSWHLLRALAARADVHCGCLVEAMPDRALVEALAGVTASHCLAPRPASLGWAGIAALVTRRPVSLVAFRSWRLHRWVRATVARRKIEVIVVFSGQMAQYVPKDFRGRVVMDFVDVDSAKYAAYAAAARAWWVRAIHAREARVLSAFEQQVARRADVSLLISAAERDLFAQGLADPAGVNLAVLGNGIDAQAFDPAAVSCEPALDGQGPHIVFTGQMDYAPNVAAVRHFAETAMPQVLARHPAARFWVVGRDPAAEVRALDGRNATRVTGAVADVRPWLAGADLVVAPLLIARGVQNKVLEAMAMARPVLLTPEAATGIDGRDGDHFAISAPDALAGRALALIADRMAAQAMGDRARALVVERYGWDRVMAPLGAIMGWADAA